ncbi:hypothetical protein MN608_07377 [Microdochium nivale]|nr:hypothetical protein MN608_07377 [Microdochium nivale]
MNGPGRLLRTGSIVETVEATKPETTAGQSAQVWQGSSKFNSKINLGGRASANQGNSVTGRESGTIRQEGSDFGGEINGDEGARLSQGNRIDDMMNEEEDGINNKDGTAA